MTPDIDEKGEGPVQGDAVPARVIRAGIGSDYVPAAIADELLEALEHLLKVREREETTPQSRNAAEAKARRVIAKARGQS